MNDAEFGFITGQFSASKLFFFFAIKGCYFRENCILFAKKRYQKV